MDGFDYLYVEVVQVFEASGRVRCRVDLRWCCWWAMEKGVLASWNANSQTCMATGKTNEGMKVKKTGVLFGLCCFGSEGEDEAAGRGRKCPGSYISMLTARPTCG